MLTSRSIRCDLRREEVDVGELIGSAINDDGRFVWRNLICVSLVSGGDAQYEITRTRSGNFLNHCTGCVDAWDKPPSPVLSHRRAGRPTRCYFGLIYRRTSRIPIASRSLHRLSKGILGASAGTALGRSTTH
jgi:hypothetical protein